jgi:flagellar secretion chaperone FliS
MSANPYSSKLSEYAQVSAHGGVAAADPHKLILMLMDGALERLAIARGCIVRNELVQRAHLVNRVVSILGELKASLDVKAGGKIATNLDELYDYMIRRVMLGSVQNKPEPLEEVTKLLSSIREAWVAAPGKAAGATAR